MSLSITYPFIYMLLGIFLAKTGMDNKFNLRQHASTLLTCFCIPLVIIYNIAYHERGIFTIMISMIVIMAIMLFIALEITKDAIKSLCFCYLNVGWLGLPIVISLYGNQAAMVIIAAYVGNSIFGNSVSAGLFVKNTTLQNRILKTLRSPPVIALILGLCLMPFGSNFKHYWIVPYDIAKFSMSFLGMLVLGLWMAQSKLLSANQFIHEFKTTVIRFLTFSALVSVLVLIGVYFEIPLISNNIKTLYFIGLLPPAANIVILETYYLKTGKSAPIITTGTLISIGFIVIYAVLTSSII